MKNKFIIILLTVCLPFFVLAQGKSTPASPKAPMTYEAFFKKDMKKTEGVLPVYQGNKKCYIEIPASAIGHDILVSGVVKQGNAKGTISACTQILQFNLSPKGNQLEVKQQICSDRSEGAMAKAIEASSLKQVLFSYSIIAHGKDKKGYIIDITADVNANGKLFSFSGRGLDKPEADRSGLDSVQAVANGVKFLSTRAQSNFIPGLFGRPGITLHMTNLVEWSMQLLPDRQVAERSRDSRVGYRNFFYNDYDANPYKAERVFPIERWNLQIAPEDVEKYKRGELVEPQNPIHVYFDETFTPALYATANRAVTEWNKCFEQAGFKNVLRAHHETPECGAAYHQIVFSYVTGSRSATSIITDPRTGEILTASALLSQRDWEDAADGFKAQLGSYEPKVYTELAQELHAEYLRYRASNALGQMLGLIPNFAGSTGFTTAQLRDAAWAKENGISASVTDGCFLNYAAQPGDGIAFADLFSKASVYDRWAIEWGYRQFPGADARTEQEALKAIAARQKDNAALRYAPEKSSNYWANANDLGQNRLETAALGLENLKRLNPELLEISYSVDKDDAWDTFAYMVSALRDRYRFYILQATDYLDAISTQPIIRGYNEERYVFLPKNEIRHALRFLEENFIQGVPSVFENETIHSVNGSPLFGMNSLTAMQAAKALMNPALLTGMMNAEEKFGSEQVFTLDELFDFIDKSIFQNYSTTKKVSMELSRIQYNIIKEFLSALQKTKVTEQHDAFSYYMIDRANTMIKNLERVSRNHADKASRERLKGAYVFLKTKYITRIVDPEPMQAPGK